MDVTINALSRIHEVNMLSFTKLNLICINTFQEGALMIVTIGMFRLELNAEQMP